MKTINNKLILDFINWKVDVWSLILFKNAKDASWKHCLIIALYKVERKNTWLKESSDLI